LSLAKQSVLIDDMGEAWPAPALAWRLPVPDGQRSFVDYAVEELGLICIRRQANGAAVALAVGRFNVTTLAGALVTIARMQPERILLSARDERGWSHRLFRTVAALGAHAEALLTGEPLDEDPSPRLLERGLEPLADWQFQPLWPLLDHWRSRRGELSDVVLRTLQAAGVFHRSVLVRQPAGSPRLVVVHSGAELRAQRPCEHLWAVGRDLEEMPDRAFGAWIGETYREAIAERRIRLQRVDATYRDSDARTCHEIYDRLIIPWHGAGADLHLLAVSLSREFSIVA
jgi:hypothetical protein